MRNPGQGVQGKPGTHQGDLCRGSRGPLDPHQGEEQGVQGKPGTSRETLGPCPSMGPSGPDPLCGQVMKDLKGFVPHNLDPEELEGLTEEEENQLWLARAQQASCFRRYLGLEGGAPFQAQGLPPSHLEADPGPGQRCLPAHWSRS